MDYEYKSIQDPNSIVPPEQRIKGYRYGPEVVPISSDAWEAVKFKPEKGVKLLGFTDAKNILRLRVFFHLTEFSSEYLTSIRRIENFWKTDVCILNFSYLQPILHEGCQHIYR